ncbi:MAG: hypothetical protein ACI3X9_06060 [Bacteroidaceae bacterium]
MSDSCFGIPYYIYREGGRRVAAMFAFSVAFHALAFAQKVEEPDTCAHLSDLGTFATASRSFAGRLHVSGGLRYDHRWLHSHGLEEDGELTRDYSTLSVLGCRK